MTGVATATAAAAPAKTKVGYYQDAGDIARARAAYDWTRLHEGHRSFSDIIAAAVMREVERVEGKYHAGRPGPHSSQGSCLQVNHSGMTHPAMESAPRG